MGHAALLARELRHEVCGADTGVYPPMPEVLKAAGVGVFEGYDAARLQSLQPDLVIVGNVITRGNPEMEWLLDTLLPYVAIALIVLFQPEIRRALDRFGRNVTLARFSSRSAGSSYDDVVLAASRDLAVEQRDQRPAPAAAACRVRDDASAAA